MFDIKVNNGGNSMESTVFFLAGIVMIGILLGMLTWIFKKNRITTKGLVLTALFAALSAVGAFMKIPLPIAPFSFQVFFVCMAGSLLGSELGALSQVLYVLIGLIGIPIFTYGGGPGYVIQPTFGYLVGFMVAAYAIGRIIEMSPQKNFKTFMTANLVGLMIAYIIGVPYLYISLNYFVGKAVSVAYVVKYGFFVFLLWDIIKICIVSIVAVRVHSTSCVALSKNYH